MAFRSPSGCRDLGDTVDVGIITRIGRAPGVRRLVRKQESPALTREDPDREDREPLWCADCGREVLFEAPRCRHCGGPAVTSSELARRSGNLPPRPGSGPADW
jgi:hypothetical protein